jgi:hypothetical protein
MARENNSLFEIAGGDGSDIYVAGTSTTYATSDDSLLGPIYAIAPVAATTITEILDKDGNEVELNYITNAVELTTDIPFVITLPKNAYSITFTGTLQVFYKKK